MALTEDNCSVDVQPKRFELKYGNKQARSLYTGQRNLYAQAAQYIQNTAPHRTAPHEWMRSPIEVNHVSAGSQGRNIRGEASQGR